jgi:hypothetical protein
MLHHLKQHTGYCNSVRDYANIVLPAEATMHPDSKEAADHSAMQEAGIHPELH